MPCQGCLQLHGDLIMSWQSMPVCTRSSSVYSHDRLNVSLKSCQTHYTSVMFHNTLKLILTNPNCPQCYGTQSTSHPTPTNTEPTSVTPPALRSHLACPSDSQNNLTDPGLNTDRLPGHRRH